VSYSDYSWTIGPEGARQVLTLMRKCANVLTRSSVLFFLVLVIGLVCSTGVARAQTVSPNSTPPVLPGPPCSVSVGVPYAVGSSPAIPGRTYVDESAVNAEVGCSQVQATLGITATFYYQTNVGSKVIGKGNQLGPSSMCMKTDLCSTAAQYFRTLQCNIVYTFYDYGAASTQYGGHALPRADGSQLVGSSYNPPGSGC